MPVIRRSDDNREVLKHVSIRRVTRVVRRLACKVVARKGRVAV